MGSEKLFRNLNSKRLGARKRLCKDDVDDPTGRKKADDWVIATGKTTTVRLVKLVFNYVGVEVEFKEKELMKLELFLRFQIIYMSLKLDKS